MLPIWYFVKNFPYIWKLFFWPSQDYAQNLASWKFWHFWVNSAWNLGLAPLGAHVGFRNEAYLNGSSLEFCLGKSSQAIGRIYKARKGGRRTKMMKKKISEKKDWFARYLEHSNWVWTKQTGQFFKNEVVSETNEITRILRGSKFKGSTVYQSWPHFGESHLFKWVNSLFVSGIVGCPEHPTSFQWAMKNTCLVWIV